jgi:SAM-dependent methyltransferase
MPDPVYDLIGGGYRSARQSDPRIAARIESALGGARSVVNVGAGSGSYEPPTTVYAVEPSAAMIAQRPPGAAPALQAAAEAIPLPDDFADAALAVLTVHHWLDPEGGLAELCRIARRRVVVFTWDRCGSDGFWLTRDYIQDNYAWDSQRFLPLARVAAALGGQVRIEPVPIPYDCADGFLAAYWRRPTAYLDPRIRASMSNFALPGAPACEEGLARLAAELASGEWARRHADLLALDELDVGYRLVIADL